MPELNSNSSGNNIDKLKQTALKHLWMPMTQYESVVAEDGPTIIVEGEGVHIKDIDGNTYIDGIGGLFLANVGHGRTEIVDAVAKQLNTLHYANTFAYATIPAIKLAEKLANIAPGDLNTVFLASGGSEAVETALKMARQYHINVGHNERSKFIARRGSYHGTSQGALSLNGSNAYVHRERYEPLLPNVRHVGNISCYRCPWGLEYPSCKLNCVQDIERMIEFEGPETIAAVIAEPVSVSNGVSIPQPEYWPLLREICDKYGILLIADEVITGFGRTGKMFASEHWGIVPDLMTFAKGVTSGYQPVGGVIANTKVAKAFHGEADKTFTHGFTYGGHPAGAVAAITNLDIIEREGLVENSAKLGAYMLSRLSTLKEHPIVGDVRGLGLLCAVELVKDKTTKERFDFVTDTIATGINTKMAELGLLVRFEGNIYLSPPLNIKQSDIDTIVDILDKTITWAEKELGL